MHKNNLKKCHCAKVSTAPTATNKIKVCLYVHATLFKCNCTLQSFYSWLLVYGCMKAPANINVLFSFFPIFVKLLEDRGAVFTFKTMVWNIGSIIHVAMNNSDGEFYFYYTISVNFTSIFDNQDQMPKD